MGYSRIPKKARPINPNNRITIDMTVASTGLLMLMDDKLIRYFFLKGALQNYFMDVHPEIVTGMPGCIWRIPLVMTVSPDCSPDKI